MIPKININGVVREMSEEEAAELQKYPADQDISAENEVAELKAQVAMLTECLLEMSEAVYA